MALQFTILITSLFGAQKGTEDGALRDTMVTDESEELHSTNSTY